nr:hypothetical protein [uncultured Bacteroides sp.]
MAVFRVGGVMPTKGDGLRLTPIVRIRLWVENPGSDDPLDQVELTP